MYNLYASHAFVTYSFVKDSAFYCCGEDECEKTVLFCASINPIDLKGTWLASTKIVAVQVRCLSWYVTVQFAGGVTHDICNSHARKAIVKSWEPVHVLSTEINVCNHICNNISMSPLNQQHVYVSKCFSTCAYVHVNTNNLTFYAYRKYITIDNGT